LKRRGWMSYRIVRNAWRAETIAQLAIRQVPRRKIEFHGVTLEEMDIRRLSRAGQCGHGRITGSHHVRGSRNAKRYEDIDELLQAGINVTAHSTSSHLESWYDVVSTGPSA